MLIAMFVNGVAVNRLGVPVVVVVLLVLVGSSIMISNMAVIVLSVISVGSLLVMGDGVVNNSLVVFRVDQHGFMMAGYGVRLVVNIDRVMSGLMDRLYMMDGLMMSGGMLNTVDNRGGDVYSDGLKVMSFVM